MPPTACLLMCICVALLPAAPADSQEVRQRMNLRWGVMPFRIDFEESPEENLARTFKVCCCCCCCGCGWRPRLKRLRVAFRIFA